MKRAVRLALVLFAALAVPLTAQTPPDAEVAVSPANPVGASGFTEADFQKLTETRVVKVLDAYEKLQKRAPALQKKAEELSKSVDSKTVPTAADILKGLQLGEEAAGLEQVIGMNRETFSREFNLVWTVFAHIEIRQAMLQAGGALGGQTAEMEQMLNQPGLPEEQKAAIRAQLEAVRAAHEQLTRGQSQIPASAVAIVEKHRARMRTLSGFGAATQPSPGTGGDSSPVSPPSPEGNCYTLLELTSRRGVGAVRGVRRPVGYCASTSRCTWRSAPPPVLISPTSCGSPTLPATRVVWWIDLRSTWCSPLPISPSALQWSLAVKADPSTRSRFTDSWRPSCTSCTPEGAALRSAPAGVSTHSTLPTDTAALSPGISDVPSSQSFFGPSVDQTLTKKHWVVALDRAVEGSPAVARVGTSVSATSTGKKERMVDTSRSPGARSTPPSTILPPRPGGINTAGVPGFPTRSSTGPAATIFVRRIVVTGNTVVTAADIRPLVAPFEGRKFREHGANPNRDATAEVLLGVLDDAPPCQWRHPVNCRGGGPPRLG
ncbi:MAG: hypothetical protein HY815_32665 [Candidatus Riflebacteria bacterium]|nr:hypothetical protein [Candidatus Riflebacteria bacterium]